MTEEAIADLIGLGMKCGTIIVVTLIFAPTLRAAILAVLSFLASLDKEEDDIKKK